MDGEYLLNPPEVSATDLELAVDAGVHPRFDRPLQTGVREARLLGTPPWVRSLGRLTLDVKTEGWRFPTPPGEAESTRPRVFKPDQEEEERETASGSRQYTRLKPPPEAVLFTDRLLYLLQPPLESLFAGKQVTLPSPPYPYQLEGIAFLMPRHAALLADEMGLGKTMQAILSLRLLFHSGLIRRALLVCPKPLVSNWSRELRAWAEDLPFEVISGDADTRRISWLVSNCPLKLVNYELLTRDADFVSEEKVRFDVVVLDEAQR